MISVCLASYNGEKYIKQQLISILSQLSENDEVIISDDNSTDGTEKIITELADERIKFFKNNHKKGFTGNFENAIINAKGDKLFLSDQDDVWHDQKLAVMSLALETHDFVISNAQIVDAELNTIHSSHFGLYNVKKGFFTNFIKTRYIGACMAFNRKILTKAFPFPTNHNYCQHDWWLMLIAEFYYDVYLIDQPLIKYRRHAQNASSGGSKSTNSIGKIIYTRLYSFIHLLKRSLK